MKNLLLFCCVIASMTVFGQNLVPNPSFEEYIDCPFSTTELENQVVDWYSWSESPDFFHVCSNDIDGFAGVPGNAWGWQNPVSGDAYAGFISYTHSDPDIREYMAVELATPLVIGEEYYIMFYTSMYDGGELSNGWCATNHIGLRFFENPNYDDDGNSFAPDNFVHLDYSEVLTDTATWTLVEGTFVADQAYDWLAIGNFFTGENTTIEILNPNDQCFGVYYIDNVCVSSNQNDCNELLNLKEHQTINFQIYPNPADQLLTIQNPKGAAYTYTLYNLNGSILFEQLQAQHSVKEVDLSSLAAGIYVLSIQSAGLIYNHKIAVR
jgi:OOP family OmpA-OmpF porin